MLSFYFTAVTIRLFTIGVPIIFISPIIFDINIPPQNGIVDTLFIIGIVGIWGVIMIGFLSTSLNDIMVRNNAQALDKIPVVDAEKIFYAQMQIKILSKAARLVFIPKLKIKKSGEINALAASNWIGQSMICVTTAALSLPDGPFRALLAHEIAHIARGDSLLLSCIDSIIYRISFKLIDRIKTIAILIFKLTLVTSIAAIFLLGSISSFGLIDTSHIIKILSLTIATSTLVALLVIIASHAFKTHAIIIHHALLRHLEIKADYLAARWTSKDDMLSLLNFLLMNSNISQKDKKTELYGTHPRLEVRLKKISKLHVKSRSH